MTAPQELNVVVLSKASSFSFDPSSFIFSARGSRTVQIPLINVLWAEVVKSHVHVAALINHGQLALTKLVGDVAPEDLDKAKVWTSDIIKAAYGDSKQRKRLKILINPVGGQACPSHVSALRLFDDLDEQGRAKTIWEKRVMPIFEAAHSTLDISYTERVNHAHDIAKNLSLDFDAVATVSGDGLIHEVLNGFAERKDAKRAMTIPVAPIPTGSGNGFCISLIGIKDGLDPAAAALNIIKGKPMKLDLCSVTQLKKRTYSFMSQAMGLMADVDLGTEHLRWMGNARFMYGFLRGVAAFKKCPITLSIKVGESDKKKMLEMHRVLRGSKGISENASSVDLETNGQAVDESMPALKFSEDSEEGWITFDKPVLYVYAGKMPYVSSDLMQFPVSDSCDGFIDLVVQEHSNRGELLKGINVAAKGGQYWINSQHYFKVHAYRVQPRGHGFLSVDGEAYPFETFQVEAHQGLATTLSLHGRYAVNF